MNFWYDIGINLLSDLIFIGLFLVLYLISWYFFAVKKARLFFGTPRDGRIRLYLSVHHDPHTTTGNVVTLKEFESAEAFKSLVNRKLSDSMAGRLSGFFAGLIGLETSVPEPVFRYVTDTDPVDSIPNSGSVVIGGPVRNQVAKYLTEYSEPWIKFDPQNNSFVFRKANIKGSKLTTQMKPQ